VQSLFAPAVSTPTGVLENPAAGGSVSGVGLVSGRVCSANHVTISFDGGQAQEAAYGTSRADTMATCGDSNNGFGLLFNWNLLGDGTHTARAFADGVQFGQATFKVQTLGVGFLRGASTTVHSLANFPTAGSTTNVQWQQANQNFVIVGP